MKPPQLTLLYDSACPICAWEKRNLQRFDVHRRLGFIDIQAAGFDSAEYGVTQRDLMRRLHAFTAEGQILTGVDTLIAAYRAVNWWWAYFPLALIPHSIAEYAYTYFADHRYAISRCFARLLGATCEGKCAKR